MVFGYIFFTKKKPLERAAAKKSINYFTLGK